MGRTIDGRSLAGCGRVLQIAGPTDETPMIEAAARDRASCIERFHHGGYYVLSSSDQRGVNPTR